MEFEVRSASLGYLARSIESYLARSIRITTFGYIESSINNIGYLTRRARVSSTSSNRGIGVFDSTNSSSIYPYSISGSTSILVNSSLYSTINFGVFPNFLILYYLSYLGPYSFYLTRYLVVIPRPFKKVLLFSRYSIS